MSVWGLCVLEHSGFYNRISSVKPWVIFHYPVQNHTLTPWANQEKAPEQNNNRGQRTKEALEDDTERERGGNRDRSRKGRATSLGEILCLSGTVTSVCFTVEHTVMVATHTQRRDRLVHSGMQREGGESR